MSTANIDKILQIIGNNNFLTNSEQTSLKNILGDAQGYVAEGFGDADINDSNLKFYKHAFGLINAEFDTFIKSIENIRSSHLPSEVFNAVKSRVQNQNDLEKVIQEVSNDSTPLESYQNAFFRMIGLPSWEDVEADTPNMSLPIIDIDGNLKEEKADKNNIYKNFLDRRQAFSTIGCSAGVVHFDLVNVNVSSADFLKKNRNFSEEAISEIQKFSDILNNLIEIDRIKDKQIYDQTISSYKSYVSSLTSRKDGANGTLFDKVVAIHTANSVGDPISWISLTSTPENFFDVDESILIQNYTGYLLFIYYAFIDSNPERALNDRDVAKLYRDLILKKPTDDSLNNIEKNIYTYSSLLFPLVKDGRISKCINDPDKIVADPFLPATKRMINGKFLRSCLLESIIRIRTDVISGTTSYAEESVPYTIGEDKDKKVTKSSVSGEFLGYLESLLIVRMFDALDALANSTKSNIEQLSVTQRRTGKGLFGSCYDPKSSPTSAVPVVDRELSSERIILNNYALLEDSIMLLLGTKDTDQDSLSLQSKINRDSSVPNSHLMSSLINLVQVPRKYINERIEEEDRRAKTQASVGSKVTKDLEVTIGIRSGVGMVDLLVIIIALLTIDEAMLVALMTKTQVESMYRQINLDTFSEQRRREIRQIPIGTAVRFLTERVNTIYKIFIELLKN